MEIVSIIVTVIALIATVVFVDTFQPVWKVLHF
jgi:hypothetical protein